MLPYRSKYLANNYKTLPIVVQRGKGIFLYDETGKGYYDFMASYSAVNQGHCHPRIVDKLVNQASKLTLCSRAFHNDKLLEYSEFMCNLFQYDKLLPTNTGVETGETAIKMARAWGYHKKNIGKNRAKVVLPSNNFWGRTITATSTSDDPLAYNNYGPYTPGFLSVPYNNVTELENLLQTDSEICAVMLEPIQGEAGIIIPDPYYLIKVEALCQRHNVLLICDEIQTGLGRMGSLLASSYFGIKPDILLLGKALSGGMLPVSAVLANSEIMECIVPDSHGSTFGGNPLGSAVALEAVKTLLDENMIDNSNNTGYIFRTSLQNIITDYTIKKKDIIRDVRGIGLMNAIEFSDPLLANTFVEKLLQHRVLTRATKKNSVRLTPPLTITENKCYRVLEKIREVIKSL